MKPLLALLLLFCLSFISCKKSGDNMANLLFIQHSWNVISENGEALRYVGTPQDYYNFSTNDTLFRYVNDMRDTANYNLLADGHTIVLYPITNGIKSATGTHFNIDILTENQFILSSHSNVGVNIIDSLKR